MNRYLNIIGTLASRFTIGKSNTMSLLPSNVSGVCLKIVQGTGSTLGRIQIANPSQSADAATKSYVDSSNANKNCMFDTFAASAALAAGRCVSMGTSGLVYTTQYNLAQFIGITTAAAGANANCKVNMGPVISGLSGITKGAIYYLGDNGSISKTATNCAIGVGVSTSEIKLNPMRMNVAYYA